MSLAGHGVMMQDKPNRKIGFHLIENTWDKLRKELSRIIGEEEAVLVAVFRFSSQSIKGDEETGEKEEEKEVYLETSFVKNVKKVVKKIKEKFKAEPYIHLHPDHGSVTFLMASLGELLVDSLRGMVIEASTCEECILNYLEGEVRLGEEVAALFYGSSANITFILPAADGRRLQIIEAVISI